MNELNLTWKEAVLHVLRDHYPNEVPLSVIYYEIWKYRKLTEWHNEDIGYNEPRLHQFVRKMCSLLVASRMAERPRRGVYVLRERATMLFRGES